jgi:hypothetical protein
MNKEKEAQNAKNENKKNKKTKSKVQDIHVNLSKNNYFSLI